MHLSGGGAPLGGSKLPSIKNVRRPPVDTKVAQSAHCGTPLTRIVLHREHHPQLQRQGSHSMPPPISARRSRESWPGRSSTYGTNRQLRMASPRSFRRTPHADRAPRGAPPTASVGALARRTPRSRGSRPTRSSARLCARAPRCLAARSI